MRSWIVVTVLAVALAAPTSALARIYKWVDEEGNVQYTQSPPRDRPAETIETRLPKRQGAPQQSDAEPEADADAGAGGDGQEQVALEQKEQMQRNCEIARQNAKLLEAGVRVRVQDQEGNRQILDEEQIAQKRAETQRQIELFCND